MDLLAPETTERATPLATPVAWQRTDTVGTEVVFRDPGPGRGAEGTAVVAGRLAYRSRWHVDLDPDDAVRVLTVACRGDGWSRTLRLARTDRGWTTDAEQTGDLDPHLVAAGRPAPAPPGIDDPARLDEAAVVRLTDSPIFVTWAVHRLGLVPGADPVPVPTITVRIPSLAVLAGTATYQLLAADRLRVTTDGRSFTYDLTARSLVAYRPGRLRLVH